MFLTKSEFLRKIYKRKKQIMKKEKREIKEFEGYFITDSGKIYSTKTGKLKRKKTSKRNYKKKNDYSVVHFVKEGQRYKRFVHRLVWQTFVGEIPDGLQVDHINGVKDDNRIENLQLLTQQENIKKYWENKKINVKNGKFNKHNKKNTI
jgi:hypothetical protein